MQSHLYKKMYIYILQLHHEQVHYIKPFLGYHRSDVAHYSGDYICCFFGNMSCARKREKKFIMRVSHSAHGQEAFI